MVFAGMSFALQPIRFEYPENKMKKTILHNNIWVGMAVISMASFMSACTGEEIAQTIGGIAIIGGAVAIGATTHCEPGEHNVCNTYPDYFGNPVTQCRDVYDDCAYLAPNQTMELSSIPSAKPQVAAVPTSAQADKIVTDVRWAQAFGMSYDASAQLIAASKAARDQKDPSAYYALGLNAADLQSLAQRKSPSAASVDAVARKLDQSPQAVQGMLNYLLTVQVTQ
jgi:hypothetical protein